MAIANAKPQFGGRRKTSDYYKAVNAIIAVLREHSTLKTIAEHLTAQNFRTPTDKPWTRDRLATYLQTNKINPAN